MWRTTRNDNWAFEKKNTTLLFDIYLINQEVKEYNDKLASITRDTRTQTAFSYCIKKLIQFHHATFQNK